MSLLAQRDAYLNLIEAILQVGNVHLAVAKCADLWRLVPNFGG